MGCTLHHAPVGRVCDGVDVRGHLVTLLALVHVDYVLGVDGQVLVRVDHHAEETRVRLGSTDDSYRQREAACTNIWHQEETFLHENMCVHPNLHR